MRSVTINVMYITLFVEPVVESRNYPLKLHQLFEVTVFLPYNVEMSTL